MKVGIDVSSMHSFSKTRGIGVYAQNLFNSLNTYTNIKAVLLKDKSGEEVDIIHYPYFDFFDTTLPLFKKKPTVVTLHDCIPLLFPKHYPPGIKGNIKNKIQASSLKGVSAVITDSHSSKEDIEKIFQIPSSKIFIVPLAPPPAFKKITEKKSFEGIKKKYNLPEKFALFIGGVNWNKNLLNMTQACVLAKIPLVLIGSAFENREHLDHPELLSFKLFLEGFQDNPLVKVVGFVPEEDLVSITNMAFCTLLPSFYEGFGLSILQSQLCGVPVITSEVSSMPEVAGEGALFIDPNNIESIKDAILSLENEKTREKIIEKGLKNSQNYSWEKTAQLTAYVYEKIG